jgi:hypothetical protein
MIAGGARRAKVSRQRRPIAIGTLVRDLLARLQREAESGESAADGEEEACDEVVGREAGHAACAFERQDADERLEEEGCAQTAQIPAASRSATVR